MMLYVCYMCVICVFPIYTAGIAFTLLLTIILTLLMTLLPTLSLTLHPSLILTLHPILLLTLHLTLYLTLLLTLFLILYQTQLPTLPDTTLDTNSDTKSDTTPTRPLYAYSLQWYAVTTTDSREPRAKVFEPYESWTHVVRPSLISDLYDYFHYNDVPERRSGRLLHVRHHLGHAYLDSILNRGAYILLNEDWPGSSFPIE